MGVGGIALTNRLNFEVGHLQYYQAVFLATGSLEYVQKVTAFEKLYNSPSYSIALYTLHNNIKMVDS